MKSIVDQALSIAPVRLDAELHRDWSEVRAMRSAVGLALSAFPAVLRSAAVMTTSELLENAIKYGEAVAAQPSVGFSLSADALVIEISVSNGSVTPESVRELEARIATLTRAEDKCAPYMAQLERLLEQGGESAGLGIFRIGIEGEFELRSSYEQQVVRVFATRRLR